MQSDTHESIPPSAALPPPTSRVLTDSLVLFTTAVLFLLLAQYSGWLDNFLRWASLRPGREAEKLLMVALVTAVGVVIFALRRWQDAHKERAIALEDKAYWQQMAQLPQAWRGQPDPESLASTAVRTLASQTDGAGVLILTADQNLRLLHVRAASADLADLAGEIFPYDTPILGPTHLTQQIHLMHDLRDVPDHLHGRVSPFRSCLALPLPATSEGINLGVLLVHSPTPHAFDRTAVRLWRDLAQQFAQAWEQAHLTHIARQRLVSLNVLHQVASRLSSRKNLRESAADVLNITMLGLGFRGGRVTLFDAPTRTLTTLAEQGVDLLANTPLPHELCAHVFERGQPLALADVTLDHSPLVSRLAQTYPQAFAKMNQIGVRSYVAVPLILGQDEVLGTLSLFELLPHELTPHEQGVLADIADQLTTAVSQHQLRQQLAFEQTRLTALMESNDDGVILVNLQGEVTFVNETLLDLLGLPLNTAVWQGEAITAVLDDLAPQHPQFAAMIATEIAHMETGNEPPTEGEFSTSKRHLHWFNRPVMSDKITLGRLIILRDVTHERLLEQLRDDLIHTAIHDLRNPIAAISGCLNMLSDENDPVEQEELLKIMRRGTHGLQELVNTILDISQLENGQMSLNLMPVNVAQLVGDVLNVQQSLARYYEVTLHNLVPKDVPLVLADLPLIKRVVQNLVDNALKFTPAGGEVTVSTAVDNTQQKLHLTVHDTGPGIPMHLQEKIFDRFTTGRTEASGNGLGLTFCKMALEAHNETIEVLSSPGAGTMFTFSLTLAPLPMPKISPTNGVRSQRQNQPQLATGV